MLSGFPPMEMAKAGDWWFDRIASNRMDRFWEIHSRSHTFSAEAIGQFAQLCGPCLSCVLNEVCM